MKIIASAIHTEFVLDEQDIRNAVTEYLRANYGDIVKGRGGLGTEWILDDGPTFRIRAYTGKVELSDWDIRDFKIKK